MLNEITKLTQYTVTVEKNSSVDSLSEKYNIPADELKMINMNKTRFQKGERACFTCRTKKVNRDFHKNVTKRQEKEPTKITQTKAFCRQAILHRRRGNWVFLIGNMTL